MSHQSCGKYGQYSGTECDIQVIVDQPEIKTSFFPQKTSSKESVLLVPAPGSSPSEGGEANQRRRLASVLKERGYTVLSMIPPGKDEKTLFSFERYADGLKGVLCRHDIMNLDRSGKTTAIVTSSLGQIALLLAAQHIHPDPDRKIIVGAPLDSLDKVFQEQQDIFPATKEMLMRIYAEKNNLRLDTDVVMQEINDSNLTGRSLDDLVKFTTAIYGNSTDRYLSDSYREQFPAERKHFFGRTKDYALDPFHHEFVQESADTSLKLVHSFLKKGEFSAKEDFYESVLKGYFGNPPKPR